MESLGRLQHWQLQEILTLMRIDKQLEANQIRRAMKERFRKLFWAFNKEDYDNPKTKSSILDALTNIKRELDRTF
jgi:IS4 transposase